MAGFLHTELELKIWVYVLCWPALFSDCTSGRVENSTHTDIATGAMYVKNHWSVGQNMPSSRSTRSEIIAFILTRLSAPYERNMTKGHSLTLGFHRRNINCIILSFTSMLRLSQRDGMSTNIIYYLYGMSTNKNT